jgi:hypothetical protein
LKIGKCLNNNDEIYLYSVVTSVSTVERDEKLGNSDLLNKGELEIMMMI